jgi:Flp pilus assembly protein TadG
MASLTRRRIAGSESGNAIIELALTLPLLLAIVMGIFDFGFMFQRYEVVTNAAREGARVGVLPGYTSATSPCCELARARASQYLASGGLTACPTCITITAGVTDSPPFGSPAKTVKQITVEVDYVHKFVFVGPILNLFSGSLGDVTLKGVSTMRIEG